MNTGLLPGLQLRRTPEELALEAIRLALRNGDEAEVARLRKLYLRQWRQAVREHGRARRLR